MGAAYGMGAAAGLIILGKASIASFTVIQSISLLASFSATVNYIGGASAYLIENYRTESFDITKMFLSAMGQTGKGLISFGIGAFFSATGNWIVGDFSNILNRVLVRQIISFGPNYYFDNTLIFL